MIEWVLILHILGIGAGPVAYGFTDRVPCEIVRDFYVTLGYDRETDIRAICVDAPYEQFTGLGGDERMLDALRRKASP